MMKKKNKRIVAILSVFTIIFTLMGGTLAFYNWYSVAGSHTGVAFTIDKDFSCSADGGDDLTSNNINLIPTADCGNSTEALQRTIKVMPNIKRDNLTILLDMWLTVDSIGAGLSNSENFMYALTTNPNSCTEDIITKGNFKGLTTNSKINLLSGQPYTGKNLDADTYYLYIWLDAKETNVATAKQSFKLSLGGECTNTPKSATPLIPDEYQQVEYIESTGTQYIDTQINPANKKIGAVLDFQFTSNTKTSGGVFGSLKNDGTDNIQFTVYQSKWRIKINNYAVYGDNYDTERHLVSLNMPGGTKIDDNIINNTQYTVASTNTSNLYLLAANYVSPGETVNYSLNGKLYSAKIYDGEKMIRHYIPCYRKSDNVIGVYDIVNDKFYTNEGTGNFSKGKNVYEGAESINYKIEGNSVQSATPTPESPIEIESVGDKTSNLADLSKTKISTNTAHVTISYDNSTGTLELTSTPTAFDYTTISAKDLGLEVGKTYKYGGIIEISGKTTTNNTEVVFSLNTYTHKQYSIKKDGITVVHDTFTYTGQEEVSLRLFFNYGSAEPAKVTFKNIYVSEVDEYEPYGYYKIPITVRGKKLNNNRTDVFGSYINTSGQLVNDNLSSYSQLIPVKPNTSYTLSCDLETATDFVQNKRLHAYDKDGNWIGQILYINYPAGSSGYKKLTGVTPSNCAYVKISHIEQYEKYIQLEEGTEATENEPYVETTKTNIYLNEPLRKVGEHVDYIDFKNNKVVRNIKEIIFNGEEEWEEYNYSNEGLSFALNINDSLKEFNSSMSTHFKNVYWSWGTDYINQTGIYSDHNSYTKKYFRPPNLSVTTVDEFKSWLLNQANAGSSLKLIYSLQTPIEEPLKLLRIPKVDGTQIIEVDTKIKPSKIEIINE